MNGELFSKSASEGSAPLANFDLEEWNEYHDSIVIEGACGGFTGSYEEGACGGVDVRPPCRGSIVCGDEILESIDMAMLESVSMFDEDPSVVCRKNNSKVNVPQAGCVMLAGEESCDDDDDDDDVMLDRQIILNRDKCKTVRQTSEVCRDDGNAGNLTGSLEDLVNNFDSKVKKCIEDYDTRVEALAPVQLRKEMSIRESQSWWTLTGEFGNMLPINYSLKSKIDKRRRRTMDPVYLSEHNDDDDDADDDDDDDEDSEEREEEDLYCESKDLSDLEDNMMNAAASTFDDADEIINELEAIMDESSDEESSSDITQCSSPGVTLNNINNTQQQQQQQHSEETTCVKPNINQQRPDIWFKETLKHLTVEALGGVARELEDQIRRCNMTCSKQTEINEQLRYNKQLNDEFIVTMLSIHSKLSNNHPTSRVEALRRPRRKDHLNNTNNMYLTTVVPYNNCSIPPSIEELQIFVKILKAIDEGSPMVPVLLTDYILKVLCPAL